MAHVLSFKFSEASVVWGEWISRGLSFSRPVPDLDVIARISELKDLLQIWFGHLERALKSL